MASRTQLRLSQVTGSFGTGAINDQIAAAATGSIATTDLQGVLSHLAGAIKRIHGEDSFSQNAAGEFAVTLQPSSNDGGALGGASNNWSDLYLADGAIINLGNDQDVTLKHVADTGILLSGSTGNNLQIRDSAIFIGSSADGVLDIEADTTINIGNDNSGVAISIGHTTSEVTINDNLTVTGNLTVNGTTTTIDTTTLLIEDSFIGLATGSADADVAQGFVFNRSSADLGNLGKTNGVFFFDGAASSGLPLYKLGVTNLKGDSAGETITNVPDSDLGELRIAVLSISGSNNLLSLNTANDALVLESDAGVDIKLNSQNNMTLDSAGTIFIDADTEIQLKDGGVQYGTISGSASGNDIGLHLKATETNANVFLNANSGQMFFQHGSNQPGLTIDVADVGGVIDAIFKDVNDSEIFRLDESATALLMSGSNEIQFDDSNEAIYSDGTNLFLKSGGVAYAIPTTDGQNGQVLKTNGSGVLTFGDATGDLAKGVYILTASHASGVAFPLEGNGQKTAGSDAITGLAEADSQGKSLDVFVNGQLLVSGASGEIGANATRDYTIANSNTVAFAFNLEIDDVVQVIKR